MGLFIPTSGLTRRPFTAAYLAKGALYNMDSDELLTFQFNPERFEFERQINWAEITWRGDTTGGDVQFTNIGPFTFDLPLLYINDPAAPKIVSRKGGNPLLGESEAPVRGEEGNKGPDMSFERLSEIINSWNNVIPRKGRPSRIKVIVGSYKFDCVIKKISMSIRDFFEDLSVREAEITIEFREWRQLLSV